jgi:hypothetical protein
MTPTTGHRAPRPGASATATADLVGALERALDALTAQYEQLTDLSRRQREAVRTADAPGIQAVVREQQNALRVIAELDQQRADLAAQLAARVPASKAGGTATVSTIAACLPGRTGDGLRERAARLRSAVETLRREQSVVRAATETVLAHLDGVMRQVTARLAATGARAGTYGRAGVVAAATTGAIDMTS